MAKRGRLTLLDQGKRFKTLCRFIYVFKYVTRKELDTFVNEIIGLKYPQWLIEYSVKRGLVKTYLDTTFKTKIYYLSNRGLDILYSTERLAEYYHFDQYHAPLTTYTHHKLLVDSYIFLKKELSIKEWVSEWGMRVGRKRFEKVPDGLLKFENGLNIALEAETSYKRLTEWKTFIYRYQYDILKINRYHGVLLIASNGDTFEAMIIRVVGINPTFCNKYFIFTSPLLIKLRKCIYNNEMKDIQDVLNLLRQELDNKKD